MYLVQVAIHFTENYLQKILVINMCRNQVCVTKTYIKMNQYNKLLDIIKDDAINPAVFKANRFLISRHKEELSKLSDEDKKEFLSKIWKETFHATLVSYSNDNIWTHLKFSSEKDMMLFWMRWKN
jgi:hypothetical protein